MKPLKAVRGATTVESNDAQAIESAAAELLAAIIKANNLLLRDIVSAHFTLTRDLTAANPATAVRKTMNMTDLPMICSQEADISGGLPRCIRVLIYINTEASPQHIYLRDAKNLRADWSP